MCDESRDRQAPFASGADNGLGEVVVTRVHETRATKIIVSWMEKLMFNFASTHIEPANKYAALWHRPTIDAETMRRLLVYEMFHERRGEGPTLVKS